MNVKNILDFQTRLACNNNREWFNAHKDEYLAIKADLEQFTADWLAAMVEIDPDLAELTVKDCMYRIYRDTRFSPDKTPYKHWIGIVVAPHGGRKSPYGCYYIHFEPGHCMFCGGVWCPEPDLLKQLRQDIYDNADELKEIFAREDVAPFFTTFDDDFRLKKVPSPFPKDFAHPDWLARKSFTVTHLMTDAEMCAPDLLERLVAFCRAARQLNMFLDYTIDNM